MNAIIIAKLPESELLWFGGKVLSLRTKTSDGAQVQYTGAAEHLRNEAASMIVAGRSDGIKAFQVLNGIIDRRRRYPKAL